MGLRNFTETELALLKKRGFKIVSLGECINTRYAVTGVTYRLLKENDGYTLLTEGKVNTTTEYECFEEFTDDTTLDI